jgi:hypothetical protein
MNRLWFYNFFKAPYDFRSDSFTFLTAPFLSESRGCYATTVFRKAANKL